MFAALNKPVCDDVNVKLVHLLSVDAEQHYMIEPALTHCAAGADPGLTVGGC